jgi:hypothetical protein
MEDKRKEYLIIVLKNIQISNISFSLDSFCYGKSIIESMNNFAKNNDFEGNFTLEEINKYRSLIWQTVLAVKIF